jgi:nitric oxide reductase NorD protein
VNVRRPWLESRHLRASTAGETAAVGLEKLPEEIRERLLASTDAVAKVSVSLAQTYFAATFPVCQQSSNNFDAWQECFVAVLGSNGDGREAAAALLEFSAVELAAADQAELDDWIQRVTAMIGLSRRLATSFVSATAPLIAANHSHAHGFAVGAWHQTALDLLQGRIGPGGWRGELLASTHLGGASVLGQVIGPEGIASWARLLCAFANVGRSPKLPEAPAAAQDLDGGTVDSLLATCVKVAERDVGGARALLETVPAALVALDTDERATVLHAAAKAPSAIEFSHAAVLLPTVLRLLPDENRAPFFQYLSRITAEFPDGIVAYVRTADRAFEGGGAAGVQLWVERGFEIAERSVAAGCAHFRLETRTAHKLLVAHSAAVVFEEVDALLRRYLVMMSRRSFQLYAGPGIWYRPPLARSDDVGLRLPERVDLFTTSEDNQLFYKLSAAHIAGRWEYGTYDFDLGELTARGWSPPENEETERTDVIGLIESFPNPLLASALFVLLDGVRIDAALARDFPGLRPDLKRLGRAYADLPIPGALDRHSERLLAATFQMTVAGKQPHELEPQLRAQGKLLASAVALLSAPEASVYDSAALLLTFYASLAFAEAIGDDEDAGGFIDAGGATVIDPYDILGDEGDFESSNASPKGRDRPSVAGEDNVEGSLELELDPDGPDRPGSGRPMSVEELRALLEQGADVQITQEHGDITDGLGLYVTDLLGKLPPGAIEELRERIREGGATAVAQWLTEQSTSNHYLYDEWDHTIGDYRRDWCRLYEIDGDDDTGVYVSRVQADSGELVSKLKREFQMMRPEQFRKVPRMEEGPEFDLNALVEAHADRRTRQTPSERLYVSKRREERDVATLFLVDMSASTDEPLPAAVQPPGLAVPRRVIDVCKDTLAVMASVLEEIGDAYAVHGFSGHGRDNVEYFHVKEFGERFSDRAKGRLGGIEPKRSTRMGAALRHSADKLSRVSAKARHLILLSDGFPQDFDYGDDRRSSTYGLRDTMRALQELERDGVQTFCITVDPAGHDYLGEMCPASRYAVIDDITRLPEELPRIYRQVTRE